MKEIPLTKGQIALVSDEDFERVNATKWTADWHEDIGKFYAIHGTTKNGKRTTERLHRFILGAKKGEYVDHINRDTLDNRRENIRIVSASENQFNRMSKRGYKGVLWLEKKGKYRAKITANKKEIILGYFLTLEEAIEAYNQAAPTYHGTFARLNNK